MKPVSRWALLGMSLFLGLNTEAADVKPMTVVHDPDPPSLVNPSLTFIQTDPGVVISGSERRVQGNAQTTNNTQTSNELVQIKLLRQSRVSQFLAPQQGTEPDTAGWKSRGLMDLDGDQIVFEDF